MHLILAEGRGSLRVETMTGSIPQPLETPLQRLILKVFGRFLSKVLLAHPIWREIAEYQEESPERALCPARQARKDMGPFLSCLPGCKPLDAH